MARKSKAKRKPQRKKPQQPKVSDFAARMHAAFARAVPAAVPVPVAPKAATKGFSLPPKVAASLPQAAPMQPKKVVPAQNINNLISKHLRRMRMKGATPS